MTDTLLALVVTWGVPLIVLATFLSCLALPIPASLVMLAGGAFAATGDIGLWQAALGALAGAVAGDHLGFLAARGAAGPFGHWMRRNPARRAALRRAARFLTRRGGVAVFLSRWLVSPLGPWVNVAAGLSAMPLRRFTPWDVAGEAVWVGLYVGAGYAAAGSIATAQAVIGNALGAIAAGTGSAVLGRWLWRMAAARD
ncbi:MAG: VTT domain-containing protein [Rhodobacteraceae bacterium]|jgi:membrane protein DedA with SNARE-associated domain|nr:VTT domain-containing protein [Paracoccaceae bacterium]